MNNYAIFGLGIFVGMCATCFVIGLIGAIRDHRKYKHYEADTAAYMLKGEM